MKNLETNENMEAINKLLLDMTQNQKMSNNNLVKVFIATIICYTILLISMVVGFFIYESQFEIIDTETQSYEYDYDQEANAEDGGTAIVNGNGEITWQEQDQEDQ